MAKFIAEFTRRNGDWSGAKDFTSEPTRKEVLSKAKSQKRGHKLIAVWTPGYRAQLWKDGSWTSDAGKHLS